MLKFTLDTNCLLALDEARRDPQTHRKAEADAVRQLVQAHLDGRAEVAVIAITASERQRDDVPLSNFAQFEARLRELGIERLAMVMPMMYFDVTFWDSSLMADEAMMDLERRIHDVLFPSVVFAWPDYCKAAGIPDDIPSTDKRWKNAKCDVLAYWSHAWHKRDVFVTSDKNFHNASKKAALIEMVGGRIETPASAAALLSLPAGQAH